MELPPFHWYCSAPQKLTPSADSRSCAALGATCDSLATVSEGRREAAPIAAASSRVGAKSTKCIKLSKRFMAGEEEKRGRKTRGGTRRKATDFTPPSQTVLFRPGQRPAQRDLPRRPRPAPRPPGGFPAGGMVVTNNPSHAGPVAPVAPPRGPRGGPARPRTRVGDLVAGMARPAAAPPARRASALAGYCSPRV